MKVLPTRSEEQLSPWIRSVFYGLKSIGLAPIHLQTYTRAGNSRNNTSILSVFSFSKIGLFYNLAFFVLYVIAEVILFSHIIHTDQFVQSPVNRAVAVTALVLNTFTSCLMILYLAFRQKEAAIIANKLIHVHFLLSSKKKKSSKRWTNIYLLMCIVLQFVAWITGIFAQLHIFSYFGLFVTDLTGLILYSIAVEYSIILGTLAREFDKLNQNLLSLNDFPNYLFRNSPSNNHLAILNLQTNRQLATLKFLHSVRTTLFELSQAIANFFSPPMLPVIACFFCSIVHTAYRCIILIVTENSDSILSTYVNPASWMFLTVNSLVLLLHHATKTVDEAKLTRQIVHKLLSTAMRPEIITELEHFSLHLVNEDVRFTACGFFYLDFTLLQSIVGATAAYLVIIIQFQLSDTHDETRSTEQST